MNLLSYLIYLLISWAITVNAGISFYKNGRHFLLNMLEGDEKMTNTINRLLLTGYFMINLGYVTMMISIWEPVTTWNQLVESITLMTGKIMLLLAAMHFLNMTTIYLYHQFHPAHNKNIHL
jgi:hypothetical protein